MRVLETEMIHRVSTSSCASSSRCLCHARSSAACLSILSAISVDEQYLINLRAGARWSPGLSPPQKVGLVTRKNGILHDLSYSPPSHPQQNLNSAGCAEACRLWRDGWGVKSENQEGFGSRLHVHSVNAMAVFWLRLRDYESEFVCH